MFDIEMLPAEYGDCLVVTYGTEKQPRRILIDGGTPGTFPRLKQYIEALPRKQRHFELLIVTHIDADHIGGVLPLLRASELEVSFGDIWFNAWHHLVPPQKGFLGPAQGDLLGNLLSQRADLPWNERFKGGTVVVPNSGALPEHTLEGGMRLTLLSPRWEELAALNDKWSDQAFKAGRVPGDVSMLGGGLDESMLELLGPASQLTRLVAQRFFPDEAPANGSSIAVLAEYKGKRALLAADAFAPVLLEGVHRLPDFDTTLEVDAFKLPHHGSKANINDELLRAVPSRRYLVSTSGQRFKHPDEPAMARVLKHGGTGSTIFFNYDSVTTRKIRTLVRGSRVKSSFEYPPPGESGMRVSLL
jgi:hypothetical protein